MLTKFLTAAALAAPAGDLVQATIRHGDLDLTSQTDLARLKLRIERKARAICSSSFDRDGIGEETLACRAQRLRSLSHMFIC